MRRLGRTGHGGRDQRDEQDEHDRQDERRKPSVAQGRLMARPGHPVGPPERTPAGASRRPEPLGIGTARDGLLLVPASSHADIPAPLVVMLHGAGGDARDIFPVLQPLVGELGFILLAPDSRGRTWDLLLGGYGPDVAFLDRALARTFERYAVDPARIAIAGFSDGASYALSIGLANGDLFTHVLAFSPGFMAPAVQLGAPRLFISHGTRDGVLPISVCSRRIVPRVRRAGYAVRYEEFDGGHTVPPHVARTAVEWLTSDTA